MLPIQLSSCLVSHCVCVLFQLILVDRKVLFIIFIYLSPTSVPQFVCNFGNHSVHIYFVSFFFVFVFLYVCVLFSSSVDKQVDFCHNSLYTNNPCSTAIAAGVWGGPNYLRAHMHTMFRHAHHKTKDWLPSLGSRGGRGTAICRTQI